ncbi:MAG: hypothetical protein WCO48_02125 [Candidatus Taylorbacteria bacterium]
MNKKLSIFLFCLICLIGFTSVAFAQSVSVINARVLPTIWYSTLSVGDGDSIYIYTGIQNNSGTDFSGVATFIVDDQGISKKAFISKSNSLIDVSTNWIATTGNHNVQVSVTTSLPTDKALYSSNSDKASISITRKITPEIIQAAALNTASSAISSIDGVAATLADKVESLKKPVNTVSSETSASSGSKRAVSTTNAVTGTASGAVANSPTDQIGDNLLSASIIDSPFAAIVWNFIMDTCALLIRNWKWTLGGLVVMYLLYKLVNKFRK